MPVYAPPPVMPVYVPPPVPVAYTRPVYRRGGGCATATAILIILFVRDELSYDKWIPGSENLWRFEVSYHVPGRSDPILTPQSPLPIPAAMRDQIPEVRDATRLVREGLLEIR